MTVVPPIAEGRAAEQVFDLLANPFAVLNVAPDATREDVVSAFEDGIADHIVDEGSLREARRQLLAPKLRLHATAEFFPDAAQPEREEAISALRENRPLSDLIALAKKLPAFSRTIFLAQIAQLRPSSGILRYFALSRAQVDRAVIAATVAELLTVSGSPRPPADAINQVIDEVTLANADRLFVRYADAGAAASDMVRCLNEELANSTNEQLSILGAVVDAYARMAVPALQAARRKVEDAAELLRRDPAASGGTQQLVEVLKQWDAIAQPQQLLASHKGRDELGARDLFQFMRGLMLELANEREMPTVALEINKACLTVFAELPRAEQQLREDQAALEELAHHEKLKELRAFIIDAREDPSPLLRDLKQSGFGLRALGAAGRLYAIFNQSLASTHGTPTAEYVWNFLRGLALELNNELGEAAASQQLIEGLHYHPKFRDAPDNVQRAIETDLQTLRANATHTKLTKAVEQKDRGQARVHLAELVAITRDPAERRQYQEALDQIDAASRGRIIKWVIWGIIGLVIVAFSMNQNSRSRPLSTSAPSYSAPAVTTTASLEEVKPQIGRDLPFNRGNVRYCLYQSARLDAANDMLTTETSVAVLRAFNIEVDDYNSRCGSYRYYPRDLSAVQSELTTRRSLLAAEGQGWVRSWRAKF